MVKETEKTQSTINWKTVISGLILVALTPFAMKLGSESMGFFSTPKDIKATNERIKADSTRAIAEFNILKDSLHSLSQRISNQSNRLNELEKKKNNKNHNIQ